LARFRVGRRNAGQPLGRGFVRWRFRLKRRGEYRRDYKVSPHSSPLTQPIQASLIQDCRKEQSLLTVDLQRLDKRLLRDFDADEMR
jgi:hypothetical protein